MNREKILAFGVNAKDDNIRYESSSGGVFSLLAEEILDNGGAVCGAALSDDCKTLTHVIVNDIKELDKLKRSKYIQSQMKDIYRKIDVILNSGRLVLFSGTPCQVAGLKCFLGNEYSNLLTVEVVCHGVPPKILWKKYTEWLEKKYGKKIKEVNFRSKKDSWSAFGIEKKIGQQEYIYHNHNDDPYLALFLKNCCLRPSCYSCQTKMMADVSLGDLWGIKELAPVLNDNKGTSLVLLNTEKGEKYWEKIQSKTVFQKIIYEKAVENNMCIEKPVLRPALRDTFFEDIDKMSFDKLVYKYRYPTFKLKIKHLIKIMFLGKLGGVSHREDGILIVFDI